MTAVDPITRSVVQHRLSSIVTAMGEAMLRTSYSQILNSSRDFSLAICDAQSRLIAQFLQRVLQRLRLGRYQKASPFGDELGNSADRGALRSADLRCRAGRHRRLPVD